MMMQLSAYQDLRFFVHKDWNVPHGFFTRHGGVSQGLYFGLNCGCGSQDNPDYVRENQRRALAALRCDASREILHDGLHTLYQHHSADAVCVPFAANTERAENGRVRGDALVAAAKDFADGAAVTLGVMTADCVPVLLYDPTACVIAAAHAGWQGALSGIIANTLDQMQASGARFDAIHAAIGPAIAQDSYQVGSEFRESFLQQGSAAEQFFSESKTQEKYQFDLPSFIRHCLQQAGIARANIAHAAHDTYADEESFFSYRRSCHNNEPDYGRNFSLIGF